MFDILEQTKKDFSPFLGLKKSKSIIGEHSEFYDLSGSSNLVVRKSFISVSFAKRTAEFQKVVRNCSLRLPKTWYVIGSDPVSKEDSLFAISERVFGKRLNEIFSFNEEMRKKLDTLYASVFLHLWNVCQIGGYVLSDFRNEQIMLGMVEKEKERHLYFTDVDPLVEFWEKGQRDSYFWEYLYRACVQMKQTEFDRNFHKQSRKRIKRILALATKSKDIEAGQYRVDIFRILNV